MSSLSLLTIFGVFITCSTLVLSDSFESSPEYEQYKEYFECRRKSRVQRDSFKECASNHFTALELNETRRLYDNIKCVECMHACRKQENIMGCFRETALHLQLLSNKSVHMVPFVEKFSETALTTICDNDGKMITVYDDEDNKNCIKQSWQDCKARLGRVDDLETVAFCDTVDEEIEPYTKDFICQKILDFLECAERGVKSCSTDVQDSVTILMTKLRTMEPCSQYF
ncbi:uncharacterized protein [Hetaerina americana]|uniref:uncharacterized protein n=1 Tax=Hetaerina americana TaxID=62018 RepID=UPI003A7F3B8B